MKQLENLDEKIPHPAPDENPEIAAKQQAEMGSYRRLLRFVCMNVRAKNVNDADLCDQARMKLSVVESVVLLEDAEFEALYQRVKDNPLDWVNYNHSRMLEYMRVVEKKKIEVVVKEKADGSIQY